MLFCLDTICDLACVMDIVIGGGVDSLISNNGVMAYNGVDGSLLWKRSSRDELFGSAIFQDLPLVFKEGSDFHCDYSRSGCLKVKPALWPNAVKRPPTGRYRPRPRARPLGMCT